LTRSAIVVGGGISGLASAIALRQAGYAVTLVEQAPSFAPAGAALSLWPNAIAGLRLLGAATAIEREAEPIKTLRVADRAGKNILSYAMSQDGDTPAFLPTRSLLQSALLDALSGVEILLGARMVEAVSATVSLHNGRQLQSDLAIMADGIWSSTATMLIGNAPHYRGYGGVLALAGTTDNQPGGEALEFWGKRERFGIFDLADGDRYWFYIRDQAEDAVTPPCAAIIERARHFPSPL
jgi:2-polyprenyl-6-methoxyphenol hydroxylase-like FAD-dependent oxidoreductase